MQTQTNQDKKSAANQLSTKKENVIDYFNNKEIINDYPVLPGKKDFMHIRGFLFNNKFRN